MVKRSLMTTHHPSLYKTAKAHWALMDGFPGWHMTITKVRVQSRAGPAVVATDRAVIGPQETVGPRPVQLDALAVRVGDLAAQEATLEKRHWFY